MALLYRCSESWVRHKTLANVFHFNLECCEYKEGLVGPQIGLLTFSCLCTPFYANYIELILHPPPFTPITIMCNISTPTKKLLKMAWILVLKSYLTTQLYLMNRRLISFLQHNPPGNCNIILLEITVSPNVALCVKARFCQVQIYILLLAHQNTL